MQKEKSEWVQPKDQGQNKNKKKKKKNKPTTQGGIKSFTKKTNNVI